MAEVDGSFLYREDLQAALPTGLSRDDSLLFIEHYIRSRVKDVLLFNQAQSNIPDNGEIDKLVTNYWRALIVYTYQQELASQRLSGEIPEQEIADHHEKNKELFKLGRPLMKSPFIEAPLTASQLGNVRKWYRTEVQDAAEHSEKYSLQDTMKYEYFYDKWVRIADVLDVIPSRAESPEAYIDKNRHIELRDMTLYCFLNISNFRVAGKQRPYKLTQPKVKDVFVNIKRVDFIKQVKDDLYKRAIKRKKIINY